MQRAGVVASLDQAGAEDEEGDGQREHQEAGQGATPAQPGGEGGDAEGEGGEAGGADQEAQVRGGGRLRGSFTVQRRDGGDEEGWAETQPGDQLGEGDDFLAETPQAS